MGDYEAGIYQLQLYARAAQVSPAQLVADFLKRYSKDDVATIGRLGRILDASKVSAAMKDFVQSAPIPKLGFPTKGDLTGILMKVGATLPSSTSLVVAGVKDSGAQLADMGFAGLKAAIVLAAVGGVVYVAWSMGWLKHAIPKRA